MSMSMSVSNCSFRLSKTCLCPISVCSMGSFIWVVAPTEPTLHWICSLHLFRWFRFQKTEKLSPLPPGESLPLLLLVPTQHCPLGHVKNSHWKHFPLLELALTSLSNGPQLFHCGGVWTVRRTSTKLKTVRSNHTRNWKCPPSPLPCSGCSTVVQKKKGCPCPWLGPIVDCGRRLWGGFLSVQLPSLPPASAAHVLPTSTGKLRLGSLTHHHHQPKPPQATKPPQQETNQPMHFCHLRQKWKKNTGIQIQGG